MSKLDQISVGASTCIFGLFGCYVGFYILNWQGLNNYMHGDEKCLAFALILLMTLFLLFFSIPSPNSTSNVDYNGHIGGLIGGILLSVIVPRPLVDADYEKNAKFACSILLGLFITLCLVFFYFVNYS